MTWNRILSKDLFFYFIFFRFGTLFPQDGEYIYQESYSHFYEDTEEIASLISHSNAFTNCPAGITTEGPILSATLIERRDCGANALSSSIILSAILVVVLCVY